MLFTDDFLPHDPTTQSGNLDQAEFCESDEVGSVIYTLKTNVNPSEIASYSITGELANYVTSQIDSTGEIKLVSQFRVSLHNNDCFQKLIYFHESKTLFLKPFVTTKFILF